MTSSSSPTTVYRAKAIHTMDAANPRPAAVAVADGRITAVGDVAELASLGGATVDDRFADHVITPGFVEAHCHTFGGGLWQFTYCGYFDRWGPDGRHWPGCRTLDAVLDRLREAAAELADPTEPLIAWGLDPIYFAGERLVAVHLDQVSTERPIFVLHASIHLATVNTAMMQADNIGPDTLMGGVPKDGSGNPIGELQEPAAMGLAITGASRLFGSILSEQALANFGLLARNAGVTTMTDLGSTSLVRDDVVTKLETAINAESFPARVSVFHNPGGVIGSLADEVALVLERRSRSTDKLRLGNVKFVLDGSIQGFTARLNPPGYLGDRPNGLWLVPPEQVAERLQAFHDAGLLVHVHCNGDQAVDVFLDAAETVLAANPRADHRHTVQHCQLTTRAQYERIKALELCVNLFANHTYYWGDQHMSTTVGPERAATMNAAATALELGIPLSIHSDSPVTPLSPLRVVSSAVNRATATGHVLGPDERINVTEAMTAATIGAAYQLKMDDEVGSLAVGKRADFAVLDDDPFGGEPEALADIGVWGTVLGGVAQPAQ
ncbi:MAG: amidohydrolase [Acidimicrobiia bacterium]|nr:amidohydrolase [Acidimicrobiia bacterium]